jgi:DNA processing protein
MTAATLQSRLSAEDQLHWLALIMVSGLGPRRTVPLLGQFRSIQAIFRASRSELIASGLPGAAAQTIASGCTFEEAADQQQRALAAGVEMIVYHDPLYPPYLKEIYDPPVVLFAKGRLDLLGRTSLGIVGTRRPTPYGMAATERLGSELAATGLVIVSGLARGIDTAAHRAALSVNGDTVAVFGSGIDHIYPAENRRLADEIATKGLLLSEYPMGAPGHPQNFPQRNRIISGVSVGVLVVEGAQYSGSAITAQLALEQGRDVFAVPGNITSKLSWAPNLLIKQGAKLVQSAEDVLSELSPDVRRCLRTAESSDNPPTSQLEELGRVLGPNAPLGQRILSQLRVDEAIHLDFLMESLAEASSSEVIATLFQLQMLGTVREMPGKNYVKVWGDAA